MDAHRRDLLKTLGLAAVGTVIVKPGLAGAEDKVDGNGVVGKETAVTTTHHELPKLPYEYAALEPYLDAKTMELHHSKHHQSYVDGLNKAEGELSKARAVGDFALVEYWSKKAAFNGGGHFLHTLFWKSMGPNGKEGGGAPTGGLAEKIKADFGSFEDFKKHFSAAAKTVEGAGWGLLHFDLQDRKLKILQAENQHKLTSWGSQPILGIDVWEHAYYLKYQNKRPDYIEAWWNVVNWTEVSKKYETLRTFSL